MPVIAACPKFIIRSLLVNAIFYLMLSGRGGAGRTLYSTAFLREALGGLTRGKHGAGNLDYLFMAREFSG